MGDYIRGIEQLTDDACLVFTEESGEAAANVAAHEVGHMLGLSVFGPMDDPGQDVLRALKRIRTRAAREKDEVRAEVRQWWDKNRQSLLKGNYAAVSPGVAR